MKTLLNEEQEAALIIHLAAVISPASAKSGGCTVLTYTVENTNALVGRGCIINTGAIIEHD